MGAEPKTKKRRSVFIEDSEAEEASGPVSDNGDGHSDGDDDDDDSDDFINDDTEEGEIRDGQDVLDLIDGEEC